ncbi:hypothetical protein BD311DRAFT_356177 [Dichomitus squalens]|uniref:Secreted protein n=1 Tax=Dichomitus squalens TaxID=114155 RepID=A0A4Q9MKX5_9APHY|nr:hypothetical protein BD311DRAFT_356177 [Dichomitus squalens]
MNRSRRVNSLVRHRSMIFPIWFALLHVHLAAPHGLSVFQCLSELEFRSAARRQLRWVPVRHASDPFVATPGAPLAIARLRKTQQCLLTGTCSDIFHSHLLRTWENLLRRSSGTIQC